MPRRIRAAKALPLDEFTAVRLSNRTRRYYKDSMSSRPQISLIRPIGARTEG